MSAVSLRTIQRAEAGQALKGFTLTALAKALDVSEEELLGAQDQIDLDKVKQINLSTLSFLVFPFANILVPVYLTYSTESSLVKAMGKKIVEMQIVWFLLFSFALILTRSSSVRLLTCWNGYMLSSPARWYRVSRR